MTKFDKEFFIKDVEIKYELNKFQYKNLVEIRHSLSDEGFVQQITSKAYDVCYYSDLLDVLKE
jgi:hypothetical protein